MKALVQISRYGGRTRENLKLLRRSDFRFFGPLRPNSLNRHAPEFHFSGTRTPSAKYFAKLRGMSRLEQISLFCVLFVFSTLLVAHPHSASPDSTGSVAGRYEGTATNKAGEVITVALDLKDADGVLSGNISSSHGDFPIVSGSRQGDKVTITFDAGGETGTISLQRTADKLVGTFSAGDDGGPVDLKKVVASRTSVAVRGPDQAQNVCRGTRTASSRNFTQSSWAGRFYCFTSASPIGAEIASLVSRARAPAPHNLASKNSSTRDRISGALFDS